MDKNLDKTVKNRIILLSVLGMIIFAILSYRLYYIQIYKGDEYSSKALKQRGKEFSVYPNRGIIFDRNLTPLTNNEVIPTIIIEKRLLLSDNLMYNKILNSTDLSKKELDGIINKSKDLIQIPLIDTSIVPITSSNIFLIDTIDRYNKESILSHVVGYTNKSENNGEAGIEKSYDEFLRNHNGRSFIVEYDRDRSFILGGSHFTSHDSNSGDPSAVKLTIDYDIQKKVENILDDEEIKGAVIVVEIESGDILALASRPNFNQKRIEDYFNSKDMALYNKGVQVGYPPGSIFKIVVLLTALEDIPNILEREYYCNGYQEINGLKINCSNTHGRLSIDEAFAQSCNSAFIQIGQELGAKKIINMAKRLGFGSKINIGLLEEIDGNLPDEKDVQGAAIGNISIGQGPLEVTPLQVTNLMVTLANKGIDKGLALVKGITNEDGYMIKEYYREEGKQVISDYSADKTIDMLRKVVEVGTGRSMDLDEIGGGGGKTGSAQASLNNELTVHGWFSGFIPSNDPQYIITVFIEDTDNGSITTLPIFERIGKEIFKLKS
ncbi:peptidoglycan D,D-transpeptidase FtsI family protein [Wansuia hejianensis]|uniref:Penicillin-binding protein 2 n=1 Tax=Wansuia hejianensis TaxID=2763667 RepID=A0A926EZQ4_9FIRM|nr:penicillin-binding protein 2 [Wansuia hejianensis]MBC8590661.1 penicillin-binding protein 2 [Wansuia hejianensis]